MEAAAYRVFLAVEEISRLAFSIGLDRLQVQPSARSAAAGQEMPRPQQQQAENRTANRTSSMHMDMRTCSKGVQTQATAVHRGMPVQDAVIFGTHANAWTDTGEELTASATRSAASRRHVGE